MKLIHDYDFNSMPLDYLLKMVEAIKIVEVCYADPDDENDNCDGCPVAPHSENCKKHLYEAIETVNNWKGKK